MKNFDCKYINFTFLLASTKASKSSAAISALAKEESFLSGIGLPSDGDRLLQQNY
jgi:hypothetical protein